MKKRTPKQPLAGLIAFVIATFGAAKAQAEPARACVWKIEHGNAVVYLAGSVHLLRQQDHPLPPPYQMAYDKSDRVYFEVDMGDMLQAAGAVQKEAKLPDGETIQDHVSEETYKKLKAYFKKRGIGGKMLEEMKPGMLAITISGIEAMMIGALPQYGVEMHFNTQATRDEKPVKGLETVEFQMSMFDNLEKEDQDAFLAMTLDEIDKAPEMLGELIDVWKAGDAEKLDQLLNEQLQEDHPLTELILYDRNANWIPAIEEELKAEGTTFVVVGAAHLVGKKNVIELLEAKGYKAKQLTYEP